MMRVWYITVLHQILQGVKENTGRNKEICKENKSIQNITCMNHRIFLE